MSKQDIRALRARPDAMGTSLLTPRGEAQPAPPLVVQRWLGTDEELTLDALVGRVVVLHAFQMLCPGCVSHGLPQAQRVAASMPSRDVAVLGLHSVFEHHAAMGEVSLRAFLHEYRVAFPVGIDQHDGDNPVPLTMQRYRFQGTPSLVLLDRRGYVRSHVFGRLDDLQLGTMIGTLLSEGTRSQTSSEDADADEGAPAPEGCPPDACEV